VSPGNASSLSRISRGAAAEEREADSSRVKFGGVLLAGSWFLVSSLSRRTTSAISKQQPATKANSRRPAVPVAEL
jgi:hypothetical protein